MNHKVTIKDIAVKCNTTPKTVSNALNFKGNVSEITAASIRKAAEEMGYIPNMAAKGLRGGQSRIIGIVIDNLLNPYYLIIIRLLGISLMSAGYDYMIYDSKCIYLNNEVARRVISRRVDGIISFLEPLEDTVDLLKKQGIPLVLVGRKSPDRNVDSVYTDDFHGGFIAAEKLVSCGHKDILVICGPKEIECAVRRAEGFKEGLKQAGLPIRDKYFRYLDIKPDNNVEMLLNDMRNEKLKYTAVFCFNDILAQSLILFLNNNGINIPDSCEIIAYDAINTHFSLPNKLTSVAYDKERLAGESAGLLISKIEQKNLQFGKEIVIETYLSLGTTTR